MEQAFFYHALKVNKERCIGCSHCMKICPTQAIRVREGKADIYGNRCIDCGKCFKECPSRAVFVAQDDFEDIYAHPYRVALLPSIFIGQFPDEIKTSRIYSILYEIGFTHVIEVESAVKIHTLAKNKYIHENEHIKPMISTFCPAVVRLIQVKFPSLVENLIHIKAPVDITAMYIKQRLTDEGISANDIGIYYITPCAAKIAAVKSPVGEEKSIIDGVINMDFLYNRVYKKIKEQGSDYKTPKTIVTHLSSDSIMFPLTNGEKRLTFSKRSLSIDEIHNVIEFLEKLENDEIQDVDFLELRACDQSCAGGILTCNNRFLIGERMVSRARRTAERERNGEVPKEQEMKNMENYLLENVKVEKIKPRSMMVLDENISIALEKMEKIREISNYLPQTDCCVCGAPSCEALAEDIVCGKAELTDCVFIQRNMEARESMQTEEAIQIMEKIWGKEKLNNFITNK